MLLLLLLWEDQKRRKERGKQFILLKNAHLPAHHRSAPRLLSLLFPGALVHTRGPPGLTLLCTCCTTADTPRSPGSGATTHLGPGSCVCSQVLISAPRDPHLPVLHQPRFLETYTIHRGSEGEDLSLCCLPATLEVEMHGEEVNQGAGVPCHLHFLEATEMASGQKLGLDPWGGSSPHRREKAGP